MMEVMLSFSDCFQPGVLPRYKLVWGLKESMTVAALGQKTANSQGYICAFFEEKNF